MGRKGQKGVETCLGVGPSVWVDRMDPLAGALGVATGVWDGLRQRGPGSSPSPTLTDGCSSPVPEAPVRTHQPALPEPRGAAPGERGCPADLRQVPREEGGSAGAVRPWTPSRLLPGQVLGEFRVQNKRAHKPHGRPAQASGSPRSAWALPLLMLSVGPLCRQEHREFGPQGGVHGTRAGVGIGPLPPDPTRCRHTKPCD